MMKKGKDMQQKLRDLCLKYLNEEYTTLEFRSELVDILTETHDDAEEAFTMLAMAIDEMP